MVQILGEGFSPFQETAIEVSVNFNKTEFWVINDNLMEVALPAQGPQGVIHVIFYDQNSAEQHFTVAYSATATHFYDSKADLLKIPRPPIPESQWQSLVNLALPTQGGAGGAALTVADRPL